MMVKKTALSVKNLTESQKNRRNFIVYVQSLYESGMTISDIARITRKYDMTISRMVKGDPDLMCRRIRQSLMTPYTDCVIKLIQSGYTSSDITRYLKEHGCPSCASNIRYFIKDVAFTYGLDIVKYQHKDPAISETCSNAETEKSVIPSLVTSDTPNENQSACNAPVSGTRSWKKKQLQKTYITREGIFKHIWLNGPLSPEHREHLWKKYDQILPELERCVREFREIFNRKNMPCLYIFIEKYQRSEIKELASFSKGLSKDVAAVENAVASSKSNGFVEGTNSKLKTIKKSMYGRCGRLLLTAKLMYKKQASH